MVREEIRNIKSTPVEIKKFGVTVGCAFIFIGIVLYYFLYSSWLIFIVVGSLLFVLGVTFPIVLKPVYKGWMVLALILGAISTRVILSIIFYLVITPIGIIARVVGKKFLELKFDRQKKSYWNYRERHQITKTEIERQF